MIELYKHQDSCKYCGSIFVTPQNSEMSTVHQVAQTDSITNACIMKGCYVQSDQYDFVDSLMPYVTETSYMIAW